MDPDVAALFHLLADRSPSERDDYYTERSTPAALRAEVESLLRADAASGPSLGGFVAAAADAVADGDGVPAGSRCGPYRLIRLLGRGGMGAVYEAEQDSPRRIVALKMITPGLAGPELVRRFAQESQVLGRLQHAGIAHIYEAGTATTIGGTQPYFAMELVRGEPLLAYADAHRLSVGQRLDLMAQICDAVDHAHQRGIIHRDLKPGNILVDVAGQPKVLDFGVARVTDSEVQSTRHTDVGQLVGTLAYMSPEQVLADPLEVDTRSDVYALGVVLYELLTRRLPYTTTGKLHDVARTIQEEPPAPLGSIDHRYRGDIETIVAKALEKDRARRYGSVAALAADIRRYLRDEPIVARPPTVLYQVQKFAKRHKPLVAGVAAVFLALVAGVIVSTWQAARALRAERTAEQEAAKATAISDFLQRDLLAQASAWGQATPETKPNPDLTVRAALDRAAANIASKFAQQPLVEASIRHTIGKTYKDLGLYKEARIQLELAMEPMRRVDEDGPEALEIMSRLAELDLSQGRYAQAEAGAAKVLEVRRRELGPEHPDTLTSMTLVAYAFDAQRKSAEAEPILTELLNVQRRVNGEESVHTLGTMRLLANVYQRQGKLALAERLMVRALEVRRRLHGEEHPATLGLVNDLGSIYVVAGKVAEAMALYSRLLEIQRRVFGEEHQSTLVNMYQVALLHVGDGRYAEAESLLVKAVAVQRRVLGDEGPMTLATLNLLGRLYVEQGRYAEAEPMLNEVLAARTRISGPENTATFATMKILAQLYRDKGDYASAEELFGKLYRGEAPHPGATTSRHVVHDERSWFSVPVTDQVRARRGDISAGAGRQSEGARQRTSRYVGQPERIGGVPPPAGRVCEIGGPVPRGLEGLREGASRQLAPLLPRDPARRQPGGTAEVRGGRAVALVRARRDASAPGDDPSRQPFEGRADPERHRSTLRGLGKARSRDRLARHSRPIARSLPHPFANILAGFRSSH